VLLDTFEVDIVVYLFARKEAAKAGRYYTRDSDALSQPWGNEEGVLYAFPPIVLLQKILSKLKKEKGKMILISPMWQSGAWMPMLSEMLVGQMMLGELQTFAHRGSLIPQQNQDPPGMLTASLLQS
jgi:hypothetical protein